MRRHAEMDFVAGVMVFPGGGVDDRDRGTPTSPGTAPSRPGGPSGSASTSTSPRRWCAPPRGRPSRSPACCSPGPADDAGHASSPTRRCTATPARRWPPSRCRSPTSCATRSWCCVPTCCGRGRTGSRPRRSAPAATTPTSSSGRCRRASAPTATTPRPTARSGRRRRPPSTTSARAGRSCCRPPGPSWTRSTVAPSPRCSPSNATSSPSNRTWPLTEGNWDIEFFNSERYNAARNRRARGTPAGRPRDGEAVGERPRVNEFVSVTRRGPAGIGTLLLSRPPTNTLTRQMYREITATAAELAHATTSLPSSCSVATRSSPPATTCPSCARSTPREIATAADACHRAIDAVAAIPKPTVAAVTGYALGSGLTLALAADWRVSGDNVEVRRDRDPRRPGARGRRGRPAGPRDRRQQGQGPGVQRAVRGRQGSAGAWA